MFTFYKTLWGFVRKIPGTAGRSRVGEAMQGHGYPVAGSGYRADSAGYGTGYVALRSGKIELSTRK